MPDEGMIGYKGRLRVGDEVTWMHAPQNNRAQPVSVKAKIVGFTDTKVRIVTQDGRKKAVNEDSIMKVK